MLTPHQSDVSVRLVGMAEAAKALNVSVKTARKMLADGTFPVATARQGKFRVCRSDDLLEYFDRLIPRPVADPVAPPAPTKRGPGRPRKLAQITK